MPTSVYTRCFSFCVAIALINGARADAQVIVKRDPTIERLVSQVNSDTMLASIRSLVSFGTRHTLSSDTDPKRGIGAARQWTLSRFRAYARQSEGRLTAELDTHNIAPDGRRVTKPVLLANVVATLKGTDPSDPRVFIISAHIDSRRSTPNDADGDSPGANDDASGCAAVLECARILSSQRFPATVVFIAFSGEEQGLIGAHAYAKKAKAANKVIEAVLNNDIVGGNASSDTRIIDNTRVRVFSEGLPAGVDAAGAKQIRQLGLENDGRSRQLARYTKEIGERYVEHFTVTLIYRNDRFLRGGDHTAFVENGFTAVRLCEMNEHYARQHQDLRTEGGVAYGDVIEHVDPEYLRKVTAVNLASLATLASAPQAPRGVTFAVKALTNTSTLSWQAPAGPAPAGYYVLVRESASSVWQIKQFTTSTSLTLPYSKDNYLFAVQSVSAAGNESLPQVPAVAAN